VERGIQGLVRLGGRLLPGAEAGMDAPDTMGKKVSRNFIKL